MHNIGTLSFVSVFMALYALLNYYAGLRILRVLTIWFPALPAPVFWVILFFVAFAFIIGRIATSIIPGPIATSLQLIGSYWLAIIAYLVLTTVLFEFLRWLGSISDLLPAVLLTHSAATIAALLLTALLMIYGVYNANNPHTTHYDMTIAKDGGKLTELRVTLVSDIHLGTVVGRDRLATMVDMVNATKPDLILLAGDSVEEDQGPFIKQDMGSVLRQLHSTYGVYAVPGNHEYYGGKVADTLNCLRQSGVQVLRDSKVEIAESIYLVGRDDYTSGSFTEDRQVLADLMKDIDRSKPIILMDHRPVHLTQALGEGVDLQVSGHTHKGQFFPLNFITQKMYDVDYGYFRRDSLQVIVSCGFGTWGPPIRVGNRPEIVEIDIRFEPK